jgi:hypothetical protein
MELVNNFLQKDYLTKTWAQTELWEANPHGPAFVDKVLALIANDERPWKFDHEKRESLLFLVELVADPSDSWTASELSAFKPSIHKNARKLLERFPKKSIRQLTVVHLFDALDLWDSSDLPFLMPRFFDRLSKPYTVTPFLRFFSNATPDLKEAFAQRTRKTQRRLLEYALIYQSGLATKKDLVWLFRFLPLDDPYFIDRTHPETKHLLDFVTTSLHQRLRSGDAVVLRAYNEVQSQTSWPGKKLDDESLNKMKSYLLELWNNPIPDLCEPELTGTKKI